MLISIMLLLHIWIHHCQGQTLLEMYKTCYDDFKIVQHVICFQEFGEDLSEENFESFTALFQADIIKVFAENHLTEKAASEIIQLLYAYTEKAKSLMTKDFRGDTEEKQKFISSSIYGNYLCEFFCFYKVCPSINLKNFF